jgi:hypothetical protein
MLVIVIIIVVRMIIFNKTIYLTRFVKLSEGSYLKVVNQECMRKDFNNFRR